MSAEKIKLTKAERRVVSKAVSHGFVMIDGAFSGEASAHWTDDDTGETVFADGFDSRTMVERCIGRGLLTLGRGFNQYVPTDRAVSALA